MVLYRYTRYWYDEYRVKLYLETYEVVRETPKGYWFKIDGRHNRWTSNESLRRYAYPTKKQALTSFIARQCKSININQRNIRASKAALEEAANILNTL